MCKTIAEMEEGMMHSGKFALAFLFDSTMNSFAADIKAVEEAALHLRGSELRFVVHFREAFRAIVRIFSGTDSSGSYITKRRELHSSKF
jgi:hypothetical protein